MSGRVEMCPECGQPWHNGRVGHLMHESTRFGTPVRPTTAPDAEARVSARDVWSTIRWMCRQAGADEAHAMAIADVARIEVERAAARAEHAGAMKAYQTDANQIDRVDAVMAELGYDWKNASGDLNGRIAMLRHIAARPASPAVEGLCVGCQEQGIVHPRGTHHPYRSSIAPATPAPSREVER